jgi:hypothetical protein
MAKPTRTNLGRGDRFFAAAITSSRQNNATTFIVVQASRLPENAGETPAPQGTNQSTYCDAAPKANLLALRPHF